VRDPVSEFILKLKKYKKQNINVYYFGEKQWTILDMSFTATQCE